MKIMNAIGYGRREAVERGASSAAVLPDGQWARVGRNEFEISNWRFQRLEGTGFLVSSEASDFPPVATKTGVFDAFLSCKGVDFSPVTEKAAFFFSPLFETGARLTKCS
jgi:hypothetical protein